MNFRKLKADEIDLRVGTVVENKGCSLLLYQNARCGMDILDETVGCENWQREHYEVKGNMFCRVGIRKTYLATDNQGQPKYVEYDWVWKSDCGTESNTEAIKGESSDSFKRALVNWGIGRELYTAPFIWLPLNAEYFEGKKLSRSAQKQISGFKVSVIEYEDNAISKLVIVDKTGTVVYQWKL